MIICGTGHRPDKLGGYDRETFYMGASLATKYLSGTGNRVISGGALGWDQMLAQAALDLNVPLTLALPFPDFYSKWPKSSQDYLELLVSQADEVKYVCAEGYAPWKMQQRNEWMVDKADKVVALWNGTSGGTSNCVKYAEKVGKPIVNLWEEFEKLRQT